MVRVVFAAAAALLMSGCNPFEPALYKECESAIQKRLRSPSGYKRITVDAYEETLTREKLPKALQEHDIGKERGEIYLRALEQERSKPKEHTLYISYDAPNAFGTLVRETASCRFLDPTGVGQEEPKGDYLLVNGKTHWQWLMSGAGR